MSNSFAGIFVKNAFAYMTNSLRCLYINQLLVWIIAHFLACVTPYLNKSFPCMCFIIIHGIFANKNKSDPGVKKRPCYSRVYSWGRGWNLTALGGCRYILYWFVKCILLGKIDEHCGVTPTCVFVKCPAGDAERVFRDGLPIAGPPR